MKFSTDILVAGDQLAMISFQNLSATLITNKEIAETQQMIFKLIWQLV